MIFLKFIFLIIIFFILFGVVTILSLIFRFRNVIQQFMNRGNTQDNGWYQQENQKMNEKETITGQPKPRNSTIDKNEGEYVDFEEV